MPTKLDNFFNKTLEILRYVIFAASEVCLHYLLLPILFIFGTLSAFGSDFSKPLQLTSRANSQTVVGSFSDLDGKRVKVYMPFTKFIHKTGRVEFSGKKGEVKLNSALSEYKISLSSKYFSMLVDSKELLKPISSNGEINLNSYFRDDFIAARVTLELGRLKAIEYMSSGNQSWFLSEVPVELDSEEGCSAAWDGTRIMVYQGDANCIKPGFSIDILLHEYGHGVLENLTRRKLFPTDVSEAFADMFMAMVTKDPEFATGFNTSKPITYIRSLELDYSWPGDWRGAYTGALIISSIFWDAVEILERSNIPQAYDIALTTLLYFPSSGYLPARMDVNEVTLGLIETLKLVISADYAISCALDNLLFKRGIQSVNPSCSFSVDVMPYAYRPFYQQSQQTINLAARKIKDDSKVESYFNISKIGVSRIEIELDIDHDYANDLYLYFELSNGRKIPVYRGLEEILIPKKLVLNNFPKNYKGSVRFIIQDIGHDYSGTLNSGRIKIFR